MDKIKKFLAEVTPRDIFKYAKFINVFILLLVGVSGTFHLLPTDMLIGGVAIYLLGLEIDRDK